MPETHRIAFVSGLGFGGSTTFLCNLAGELSRRRIPVMVVSPESENPFAADFQTAGVNVVLHDDRSMIFEDRMEAMLKTLMEFKPTIVVGCLGETSYEVLRYVPRGVFRMAVIQSDHLIFYDAARPYAGFMDGIAGVSEKIKERLETMEAFRAVAKHCLPYGVAMPETFEPRGRNRQPLRVLYFGRIINEQKRVHLFPTILAALKKSGIPFSWTIAGEGDRRRELERLMSSDHPGQRIRFIGSVPYSQVDAMLNEHDIFLLASEAEGLPLSLLEAMGHGLVPVVTQLDSGIRDVVDASNGMLVPMDDVEGYARAIIHLHEQRDELAAKSSAAHERVRNEFSVGAMTDRWLSAFPPTTTPISDWPEQWIIKAPLVARHPVYFSPPMRVLRRLAAKFR